MSKINEEMLQFFVNKYLGYMTADSQKQVEVTDQGFSYKGELIVSIPGLRDTLIVKEPVTVGDLKAKKEERKVFNIDVASIPEGKAADYVESVKAKFDPRKVDVVEEEPVKSPAVLQEKPAEEPVVETPVVPEAPVQKYPGKRRGPKPKNKS